MSPVLREDGRTLVAYVGDTNSLSWSFIGFPHKPSYSASSLNFFAEPSLFNHSLYLQFYRILIAKAISSSNSLDPPRLDPSRHGGLACCSPWGHKESDMTE